MVATLLLSGCVAGESTSSGGSEATDAPPAAEAATFDDDKGALRGTVINDEGLPVEGVLIGILELALQSSTAQNGEYSFSNLSPGEYTASAATLGYDSASKRVTIEAGAVAQVNFQLLPIAIDAPYHLSVQENGNIQCSLSWEPGAPLWVPNPSQPTNTSAGLLAPAWYVGLQACGVVGVPTFEPTKFILNWDNPPGTYELLAEMVWDSTQALGSGLSFAYEHPDGVNDGSPNYGITGGQSPLRDHVNHTQLLEVNTFHGESIEEDEFPTQARGFSNANTTNLALPVPIPAVPIFGAPQNQKADVGFVLDQRFVIWQTSFIDLPMPIGFSALADE